MDGQAGGGLLDGHLRSRLAVDTMVEVDDRGLGGHGGMAVLRLPSPVSDQVQETLPKLERRRRNIEITAQYITLS